MQPESPSLHILRLTGVSLQARAVLLGLLSFRNRMTGQCNPKVATLCERLGVPERTVYRRLRELRLAGVLEVRWHQRASSYTFRLADSRPMENSQSCSANNGSSTDSCSAKNGTSANSCSANSGTSCYANDGRTEPPHPYMNQTKYEHTREGREGFSKTTSTVAQPVENRPLFPLFWSCFRNAGLALSDREQAEARRLFERYPRDEQERIGKWVLAQLQGPWRAPEWTAHPLRVLREERWKRVAAERIVPKPPGSEDWLVQAILRRRAEEAARGQR